MNYRSFFQSSEFVSTPDLAGREVPARIARIAPEDIQSDEGQKKTKLVATFHNKKKRLVLNKVNSDTLSRIAGSDDTDLWVGLTIVLYPVRTSFKGKEVEGVRIRAAAAPGQPVPALTSAAETDFATDHEEEDDIPF